MKMQFYAATFSSWEDVQSKLSC